MSRCVMEIRAFVNLPRKLVRRSAEMVGQARAQDLQQFGLQGSDSVVLGEVFDLGELQLLQDRRDIHREASSKSFL